MVERGRKIGILVGCMWRVVQLLRLLVGLVVFEQGARLYGANAAQVEPAAAAAMLAGILASTTAVVL